MLNSRIRRLSVAKMSILLKIVYVFHTISMKIQISFIVEI